MGTALITGASSGLGLEFAWQLAAAKHNLVLVARSEETLERVAVQIRAVAGVDVEVIVADLGTEPGVAKVVKRLKASTRPVGLLVNNAGYSTGQPFIDGDLGVELTAIDVLVRAVMVLSHAAAGEMVKRGRGAILNVSSIAALTAMGTYSANKAWVKTFTEALAVELRGSGVTATALCPGLVHTDFHRRAGWGTDVYPEIAWLGADTVVSQALADVRRGVVISIPSVRYLVASQIAQRMPRWAIRKISGGQAWAARRAQG